MLLCDQNNTLLPVRAAQVCVCGYQTLRRQHTRLEDFKAEYSNPQVVYCLIYIYAFSRQIGSQKEDTHSGYIPEEGELARLRQHNRPPRTE